MRGHPAPPPPSQRMRCRFLSRARPRPRRRTPRCCRHGPRLRGAWGGHSWQRPWSGGSPRCRSGEASGGSCRHGGERSGERLCSVCSSTCICTAFRVFRACTRALASGEARGRGTCQPRRWRPAAPAHAPAHAPALSSPPCSLLAVASRAAARLPEDAAGPWPSSHEAGPAARHPRSRLQAWLRVYDTVRSAQALRGAPRAPRLRLQAACNRCTKNSTRGEGVLKREPPHGDPAKDPFACAALGPQPRAPRRPGAPAAAGVAGGTAPSKTPPTSACS